MTIRTRLSLWYAAVMLVSLTVMGALSYYEFVVRHPTARRESVQDDAESAQDAARGRAGGTDETLRRGGRSASRRRGVFNDVVGIIVPVGVPAILMAVAGGWWLTRRSLAPIEALTRAVERTHERTLHEQLPRTGNGDELDRLTEVFNAMMARLDQSFQRIREFTLHASHELKTPLTVMQGEIETACRDEQLTEAQRDRLLSQLDEIQRLARFVDALSLLTKADAGQVSLAHDEVRFEELVREAVDDAQHLGRGQAIDVTLAECEPVNVRGDRHRLRQLLLNLTDNAIKYNVAQGAVTVSLRVVDAMAELVVSNTGPGLPRALQPRVFERFFRGDPSHSSEVDGSGLGLSIVQWIVHAHGGTVQFESDAGAPTVVTVRLPSAGGH